MKKNTFGGFCQKPAGCCPYSAAAQSSDRIQRRLIASPLYHEAATVVLYAAKDNEVATWLILEHALGSGRRVLFPKIISGNSGLSLFMCVIVRT